MFKAPNNIYHNWNKELYIANKKSVDLDDYGNEIVVYDTPFYFGRVNYEPLNQKQLEAFMEEFGEFKSKIVSLLINYTDDGLIKEFDKAYLYDAKPEGETVNGENANYLVRAYKPQNTKIMILFEELIKEE